MTEALYGTYENPHTRFLKELESLDRILESEGWKRHCSFSKKRDISKLLKVLKYTKIPYKIEQSPTVHGYIADPKFLYVKKENYDLVDELFRRSHKF